MAQVELTQEFPRDFSIYDTRKFLSTVKLFNDHDLELSDKSYKITDKKDIRKEIISRYTELEAIEHRDKMPKLPSVEVEFDLSKKDLEEVFKAVDVLKVPDLTIRGKDGVVSVLVHSRHNSATDHYSIVVGKTDAEFEFHVKLEILTLYPCSYHVEVCKANFCSFTAKKDEDCPFEDLKYLIAFESDDSYYKE